MTVLIIGLVALWLLANDCPRILDPEVGDAIVWIFALIGMVAVMVWWR